MLTAIELGRGGVVCKYAADTNLRDVLDAIRQYLTHPNCTEFKYVIHDFSGVKSFTFSDAEFSRLASYALEHRQEGDQAPRCAITNDDTVKRVLDLYAELTGRDWQYFTSMESACNWARSR